MKSSSHEEEPPKLPLLPERDLGPWPEVKDRLGFTTPDVGETTIVERVLGKQPNLAPVTPEPKANRTPHPSTPKVPKEPRVKVLKSDKGGGWQVLAENYGKGLKVRCKAPYDGSYWEADHDALVDAINTSLKAKGKTLIGEPGPSQKSYGASSGLREPQLWTRI